MQKPNLPKINQIIIKTKKISNNIKICNTTQILKPLKLIITINKTTVNLNKTQVNTLTKKKSAIKSKIILFIYIKIINKLSNNYIYLYIIIKRNENNKIYYRTKNNSYSNS